MVRGRLEDAGSELTHSKATKTEDNCSLVSEQYYSVHHFSKMRYNRFLCGIYWNVSTLEWLKCTLKLKWKWHFINIPENWSIEKDHSTHIYLWKEKALRMRKYHLVNIPMKEEKVYALKPCVTLKIILLQIRVQTMGRKWVSSSSTFTSSSVLWKKH